MVLGVRQPALTDDDSSEHGPDLDAWDILKGVRNLLKTAPVTEHSLDCIYWVLKALDRRSAGSFDEDPQPVFSRWRSLSVSDKWAN